MIIKQITIEGEVISKKNNVMRSRWGIIYKKPYRDYSAQATEDLEKMEIPPIEADFPILMHFFFYRRTLRQFDYNNMSQGPQDLLTAAGIIPDDSMKFVIPVFHGPYAGWVKDKENPRVEITITSRFD